MVVCGSTGSELTEVVPAGATLVVVAAEVGLVEAALVGPAAAEVVVLVVVAGLAAAEASLQLALHHKSDSFYMEACTRYHCIFQSLSFAAHSTYHFYLSLVAPLLLFMMHNCPPLFVIQNVDSELPMMIIFIFMLQPLPPLGVGSGCSITWGIMSCDFTGEKEDK
jgi:hypothetical protein